jgi:hypothetical protein
MSTEPRADVEIARLIRRRVPDWWETIRAEHVVRFTDPDEDWSGRYIEVDGRVQDTLVVDDLAGTSVGPTVIGFARGMCVRTVVPHVSDHADRERAINAAVAIGALPDENGMTR